MIKLNIDSNILDKLGFSEYWDKNGDWGGRTLLFKNDVRFRIVEQLEMDDIYEGYGALGGCKPLYVSNHFYFAGWFATPSTDAKNHDLFFLHEMYECIEWEYPDCLEEFVSKCESLNMKVYIDDYLSMREPNNIN